MASWKLQINGAPNFLKRQKLDIRLPYIIANKGVD
jgi:hypothetical protein